MDEKRPPPLRPSRSSSFLRRPSPRRRLLAFAMLIALLFLYFSNVVPFGTSTSWLSRDSLQTEELHSKRPSVSESANRTRVPLEAHVMSKCPDARDCLRNMVVPTMENVTDKVDFRLSFIGDIDHSDSTVHCKHGPTECLGNQLALCAASLYPNNTKISLGFSTCLISSYRDIPARSLVESCALEHAVDFDDLNKCVSDDGRGEELLRDSVQRSKDEGVVYSCTVRLAGKVWCIRDSGTWKDCRGGSEVSDLVKEVNRLYEDGK